MRIRNKILASNPINLKNIKILVLMDIFTCLRVFSTDILCPTHIQIDLTWLNVVNFVQLQNLIELKILPS